MKSTAKDILGTTYLVKFGSKEEIELPENLAGACKVYTKRILISTDKGDCETNEEVKVSIEETLAHEVLHAFLNECGVILDEENEEKICDFYMKNWRKLHSCIETILMKVDIDKLI